MRKFLTKTLLIISTSLISILAVYTFLFLFSLSFTGLASEVYYVLDKAECNSGLPDMMLGDSVCHQLWPPAEDTPTISTLVTTGPITPAGNYLLLKNYLEHNPQTKEVFYVVRPQSLNTDVSLSWGYQEFVIPLINPESMKLLDDYLLQKLYDTFGKLFVDSGYVKSFLRNNNLCMRMYLDYVQSKPNERYGHKLSRVAVTYLHKMKSLCYERGIKLHMLPSPLADTSENHSWDDFRASVREHDLEDIFTNFIDRIIYCPVDWFVDGIHFKKEILKEHSEQLKASIMN